MVFENKININKRNGKDQNVTKSNLDAYKIET
jgi:hypothetical protein